MAGVDAREHKSMLNVQDRNREAKMVTGIVEGAKKKLFTFRHKKAGR